MLIKVRATQRGYYRGRIIEPGTEFSVDDEAALSEQWMETPDGRSVKAAGSQTPPKAGKPVKTETTAAP